MTEIEHTRTQRNNAMDAVSILLSDRDILSEAVNRLEKENGELKHQVAELTEQIERLLHSNLLNSSTD